MTEQITRNEFVKELCRFIKKNLVIELPNVGTNKELINKATKIIAKKLNHIKQGLSERSDEIFHT